MERSNRTTCSRCGAAIVFLPNEHTGKLAPIDTAHDPDGPIVINANGTYHVLKKSEREGLFDVVGLRHANHWQTCPKAEEFRKDKKR